ncbi:tetratricopeptide repeat protein [Streptomyces griseoviridis]|uniref:NB-ARC domain-containing protein n=2 Tax=Streptomyces griseoviridis TaxID=45398 RepID=A0ABT9LHI5_STRGD|nr:MULTISPECIES: tetratricopeptide repeat protein [Streptomyces]MDP9683177.1 hypothetical protein [Streptomyces griseoviridis]GGS56452.1 hypothetical protein GCM10010238_52240 [Streptomyces niveoruber]GGT13981.1 hypothetical protein GCM10010240_54020 [Streptomyces griseoviridis]
MSGVFDRRPGVAASGDEAVAAGRDIGTAVTAPGAIGKQHIEHLTLLAAAPPAPVPRADLVDAPPGLTNLPERPRLFVGRRRELDVLRAGTATGTAPLVHVVHGLGGVGKTTLAAHWAADHAAYSPVWWIAGDDRAAVDAGLGALATALLLRTGAASLQEPQLRDWALQWLAAHDDWLIVIDNVSEPADVKHLLAAVRGGRFLITSRRSTGWHGIAETMALDALTSEEAVELFARIAPDAGDAVADVCSELGHLPLAIEQAAAYCLESGTAAERYLALLADYPADMYTATFAGRNEQRTVARVWRVTLDRLADVPLAVTILLTVAWYAPDDIPRSFLDGLGSPPAVDRAIGRLAAHSMVTLRGTSALSLHRLVQAVSRTADPEDPHRDAGAISAAREIAAECLVEAVPEDSADPGQWRTWRRLLPHVEALAGHTDPAEDSVDLARVFSRVGQFAGHQMTGSRAKRLLRRGEAGVVRHLGPDHLLSLVARNRRMGFQPLPLRQALDHVARCERVLGSRHPETITARYELTASYLEAADLDRALLNVREAVALRSRVLGPEHPETLEARWGELRVMAIQDDGEAAVDLVEQLLTDCTRVLGDKHPLTLTVRGSQTQVMSSVGRSITAMMFRATREIAAQGEKALAEVRTAADDLREAHSREAVEAWVQEALPEAVGRLADCEAALGREHADTIAARLNLAHMHLGTGDFDAALGLARQAAQEADRYVGADSFLSAMARACIMNTAIATRDVATGTETLDWFRRFLRANVSGGSEAQERAQAQIDAMENAWALALAEPPAEE